MPMVENEPVLCAASVALVATNRIVLAFQTNCWSTKSRANQSQAPLAGRTAEFGPVVSAGSPSSFGAFPDSGDRNYR